MDLDDKAQNIVRLVDDNTLAKTDAKNQIRVLFFDRWYNIERFMIHLSNK